MWERMKLTLGQYADPRYLKWLLLLLGLIGLILGAGAPGGGAPGGSGGG
jgi:hypothetical protein